MLGDTAVAVHRKTNATGPGSKSASSLMNREIPIIADAYVDPAFGSGAVKITPAHDPNDFEIGQRHDLEIIKAIGNEGTMTADMGKYAGLDRYEARRQIVADLKNLGFLEKIEDYTHAVGHCQRCKTEIEPLVSLQWFVKMKPLAEPAVKVVNEDKTRFVPQRFTHTFLNWMENIRDWCISRQIWWGHRIPAWYCSCGEMIVSGKIPLHARWFAAGLNCSRIPMCLIRGLVQLCPFPLWDGRKIHPICSITFLQTLLLPVMISFLFGSPV